MNGPFPTPLSTLLRYFGASLRLVWQADPLHCALLVFLAAVQGLAPVALLYGSKLLIDAVAAILGGPPPRVAEAQAEITRLILVQALLTMAMGITRFVMVALADLLNTSLQRLIQEKILSKASQLDLAQLEAPEVHDALRNALREAGSRPLSVLNQGLTLVQVSLTILSLGTVLLSMGGSLMLLVVAAALPIAIVTYHFDQVSLRITLAFTESSRLKNYLTAILGSDTLAKEIRLFQFSRHLIQRWTEQHLRYRQELTRLLRGRTAAHGASEVLSATFVAAATFVVVQRISSNALTVGDFAFLVGGLTQAQSQFTSLFLSFTKAHSDLLYLRNLFHFLELPNRDLHASEQWLGPIESIQFDSVSFSYTPNEPLVLKDVSFTLHRGEVLALIGENGAGKSTLIKLLAGLYAPTQGRIMINGQDVSRYDPSSMQREISAIFQDFGQFHLTAAENIHAGQPSTTAQMQEAAEKAGILNLLNSFSQGQDQQLGRTFSGGAQLSGGQWQRLALARLFHKPASLWILDEPTAALDASVEQEVSREVERHRQTRISVLVSHRLSMARIADQILVLEAGRIVERGTHEELLQNRERYATLYSLQAESYLNHSPIESPTTRIG